VRLIWQAGQALDTNVSTYPCTVKQNFGRRRGEISRKGTCQTQGIPGPLDGLHGAATRRTAFTASSSWRRHTGPAALLLRIGAAADLLRVPAATADRAGGRERLPGGAARTPEGDARLGTMSDSTAAR